MFITFMFYILCVNLNGWFGKLAEIKLLCCFKRKKKKKEKPHKVTRESGIRTARFKLNRKCSHIIPVAQVTGVRKVSVDNALT